VYFPVFVVVCGLLACLLDADEQEYRMIFDYLEMKSRTDVSNTRLDMLRELLDVLQSQMENAHAVKLEWIVIWLIVTEVVLQMVAIFGTDQPTKLM
jgi:uncharacterized Rmd1/YagE family protein